MSEDAVRLQCIKINGKLRVRVVSPGYNLDANTQFPRDIRLEGRFFEIPRDALSFSEGAGRKFFYRVPKRAIRIVENEEQLAEILRDLVVYEQPECVICLSEESQVVLVGCGHFCMCQDCDKQLKKRECPLCRAKIVTTVTRDQL